jgi:hypothetical protein
MAGTLGTSCSSLTKIASLVPSEKNYHESAWNGSHQKETMAPQKPGLEKSSLICEDVKNPD